VVSFPYFIDSTGINLVKRKPTEVDAMQVDGEGDQGGIETLDEYVAVIDGLNYWNRAISVDRPSHLK